MENQLEFMVANNYVSIYNFHNHIETSRGTSNNES